MKNASWCNCREMESNIPQLANISNIFYLHQDLWWRQKWDLQTRAIQLSKSGTHRGNKKNELATLPFFWILSIDAKLDR